MLDKKRTAIIFTANTPHLAHANLMIDSLFDKNKGNFEGDLWVISTGLSERAKSFLDSKNIRYLVSELKYVYEWKDWKKVAKAQPEYSELRKKGETEEVLREAFAAYRNKRLSKLIILDWVKKFGAQYDFIVLGDNDLYFQNDIHQLFEKAYERDMEAIHYWQEENAILPGTPLWKKDFHYSRLHDSTALDFGKNEINIGFVMGTPDNIYTVFNNVKKMFFELNSELFINFKWHDQDLVRVDRAMRPDKYRLFDEGDIIHLCNGGENVVEETEPRTFVHKKTGEKLYMVHFAGGAWKKYNSIAATYNVDPNEYYFSNEVKSEYAGIRTGSLINIFDATSKGYYTEQNKKTKDNSRNKWLDIRNNGKKNVLFIGWLETGTHKNTIEAIPGFFDTENYNLAILNGNVTGKTYEGRICEEFPLIISQMSRIIKDTFLIRIYGDVYPNIPQELLEDAIHSAMYEYGCSERAARALANLVYLYFSDALDFYCPDVVSLWGFLSPWGKLINNICKWKNIPICSLEWGVLPGTVAFDFCGHMADSWIAVNADEFKKLDIDECDIQRANDYLAIAADQELSRNNKVDIEESVIEKITYLKKSGKKIILYMESNSAHSGNTFADEKKAKHHSPFFYDDAQAYEELQKICKNHEDWHIVYKPHPISITRGLKTQINHSNTTLIINGGLNESIALADITVTILSQSAYVSLIMSKPTVLFGKIQLNASDAAYVLDDKVNMEKIIKKAIENGYTAEQKQAFVEHVARVMKYYVFSANKKVEMRDSYELADTILGILEGKQKEYYKYERQSYEKCIGNTNMIEEIPMVSVVMPVYNAEEYLAACVNSLRNQTLKNIEIICINNGSTDNSAKVLKYLAAIDSRVKVLFQEEPNQRTARNYGFKCAKGKYLYLMDSDDYLDYDALEKLVNVAEKQNTDLLYFFFREVRTDTNTVRPRPRWYEYRKYFPNDKVFPLSRELYKFFVQYPFPWAKLMRRDFVLKNDLYFDNDCSNFDDNPHNLRTLLAAKNPYVYHEQFYNFRIHSKSMTQSVNPRIAAMIDAVRIMNDIYEKNNCYFEFQQWYVPYKIHLVGWAYQLLPGNLKEEYWNNAKKLFRSSDTYYFENDESWSYFNIPSEESIKLVSRMLTQEFPRQVIHNIKKEAKTVELEKNNIVEEEKKPWEEISKVHLVAIKICEKLHIINLAIKIKKIFIRK